MKITGRKFQNRLWLGRRRRGLEQKQMAYLMGHKTLGQFSRYETGSRLPKLPSALKLEIILGLPLRLIYPELYEELRREVKDCANSPVLNNALVDLFGDGRCEYAELLNGKPTKDDLQTVRRHATKVVNKISEVNDTI